MHPLTAQALVAQQINDLHAKGAAERRVRQARRSRRPWPAVRLAQAGRARRPAAAA
jgi:hypothetical protein